MQKEAYKGKISLLKLDAVHLTNPPKISDKEALATELMYFVLQVI